MWFYFYNVKGGSSIAVFILVAVLIILYCAYILYNIRINYKLERQSIELEQQKFYNAALDKTLDNLRRFKHGYNNNLNVLYSFAKMCEYDKLIGYFDEIMEMNSKLNDTTALNIKNAGLYGIISSKIQYSEEKGVKFKINTDGEIKDIKDMRISELCEIMGIFLDNAIEAAATSEDKSVTLNIAEDADCIAITVSNSCGNPPDLEKIYEKGYSTKGEGRGMGLWIVKDILKNYKNALNNAYMENGQFHQELIIKKGS